MRKHLFIVLRHTVLFVLSVIVAYPVLWMVLVSFKDKNEFYNQPWGLPSKLRWENYIIAFIKGNIGRSYINSLIVVGVSVVAIVIFSFLASYAIGRIRFKTSSILFIMFVSTICVPIQVRLLPIYILEKEIHVIDTLLGLIFPYICGGLPFSVFLLVGFLKSIPMDIDEAATIDGCGRLGIVTQILMPLSRPGLASVIIFQFMNIWNDMFLPLVLIQNPNLRTLTIGLLKFKEMYGNTDFIKLFAALVMINVPILIIYIIFQHQFISGLTSGSVKS